MTVMNDKVYCRYAIIDLYTGYVLKVGEKWKDIYILMLFFDHDVTFSVGFKKQKIKECFREIWVKNRPCLLVMWANAPHRNPGSVVTSVGCCMSLKGKLYDVDGKAVKFTRLLRSLGYTR